MVFLKIRALAGKPLLRLARPTPLTPHHHGGTSPYPARPGPWPPAYSRRKVPVQKPKKRGGGTPSPHGSHPPDPRPTFLMAGVPPYPTPRGEGGLPLSGSNSFTCSSRGTFDGDCFFRSVREGGEVSDPMGGWGYPPPTLFDRGVPPPSTGTGCRDPPFLRQHPGKHLLQTPAGPSSR